MPKNRINSIVLISLMAAAVFLCFMIIRPFLKPTAFAGVLVILFYPLHSRILKRLPYPNLAALLSTLLVVLLIVVLVFGLGGILGSELKSVYGLLVGTANVRAGRAAAWPGFLQSVLRWLDEAFGFSLAHLELILRDQLQRVGGYFLSLAAGAFRNFASLLGNTLASFFILFFLFRDGAKMQKSLTSLLPSLGDRFERLFEYINEALVATVYGTLVIASIQGALTGVAFWRLGVRSPILWGVVTAGFALLPVIGTGFVWIPAAVILGLAGHIGKALALVVWCTVVVHPVDNILRPFWISGRIKELNTLYLFVALLGGLKAFGFLGLFVGPVVLSLTWALFKMLKEEISEPHEIRQDGAPGAIRAMVAGEEQGPDKGVRIGSF
jgi:predicted PurR-regulated permease PerM